MFGHTGFMLALDELGLDIAVGAGSSAGAIVGGIIASGTPARVWADALAAVRWADIWVPRSRLGLLAALGWRHGRGLTGLSGTSGAIRFLERQLSCKTFERCRYPFAAVALDLGEGRKTVFTTGALAPRLMASAAMPGFYEPVEIDGRYYTDGAVIDLAPAEPICCRYELDVMLVHHVAQRDRTTAGLEAALRRPWSIVDILHRLIYRQRPWYATGRPRSVHACPCGCAAVIVVIEPRLPELAWPRSEGGAAILSGARRHALEQLAPLLSTLARNPRSLLADSQKGDHGRRDGNET